MRTNSKKIIKIKCPRCGWEYLPEEIYIPKNFLGHAKNIIKNADNGEIESWSGNTMDLFETYTCDNCNSTFNIEAKIAFNTSIDIVNSIEEEYTTKLYPERMNLALSEE